MGEKRKARAVLSSNFEVKNRLKIDKNFTRKSASKQGEFRAKKRG